jgi:hypothetical protein
MNVQQQTEHNGTETGSSHHALMASWLVSTAQGSVV